MVIVIGPVCQTQKQASAAHVDTTCGPPLKLLLQLLLASVTSRLSLNAVFFFIFRFQVNGGHATEDRRTGCEA